MDAAKKCVAVAADLVVTPKPWHAVAGVRVLVLLLHVGHLCVLEKPENGDRFLSWPREIVAVVAAAGAVVVVKGPIETSYVCRDREKQKQYRMLLLLLLLLHVLLLTSWNLSVMQRGMSLLLLLYCRHAICSC